MSGEASKTCPHCGAPMASTGAPIWEDYCTNKRCTVERDAMLADIRQMQRQRAALHEAVPDMLDALKLCQAALATMIAPDAIKNTSVLNAFAQATEAECKARAALSKAEPT